MLRTRLAWMIILFSPGTQSFSSAQSPLRDGTLRAHMQYSAPAPARGRSGKQGDHALPAVLWLTPLTPSNDQVFAAWRPRAGYRLLQKDRTFRPHLLVVPTGSAVAFPNADPFFHNVFSLFNGKRFDLGLYEAGSSKAVTFSRQGASYIFCNIHPEMSAVVLALSTPYFSIADAHNAFELTGLPSGEYDLQVWVEGASDAQIAPLRRRVHVGPGSLDLGALTIALSPVDPSHRNLFGESYPKEPASPYGP